MDTDELRKIDDSFKDYINDISIQSEEDIDKNLEKALEWFYKDEFHFTK